MVFDDPKRMSSVIRNEMKKRHAQSTHSMPQHGFVERKQEAEKDHNTEWTNSWLKLHNESSHVEGYIMAIKEQEINTRALKKRREEKDVDIVTKLRKIFFTF